MTIITIKRVLAQKGENEEKERVLKFRDDAPFKTEVLPTLMKIQEFSCGSVIWIDSGARCRRNILKTIERPLMAPIRIRNSGIGDQLGTFMNDMLRRSGLNVINAVGERFLVTLGAMPYDDATTTKIRKDRDSEKEPDSGIKVTPIAMTAASKEKADLFAPITGYVPKRVHSHL